MSGRGAGRAEGLAGLIARQVAPNNILAEQAVLGAMLLEPEALAAGVNALTAAMFFKAAHARICGHSRPAARLSTISSSSRPYEAPTSSTKSGGPPRSPS